MSVITNYTRAIAEVLRHEPVRSPQIISRLLYARLKYEFGPDHFFAYDLHNRRSATWPDYFPADETARPIMKVINQTHRGPKITLDKVLTTDMLSAAGVPVAPITAIINRNIAAHPIGNSWDLIDDIDHLIQFLDSESCPSKLFSKPVGGQGGSGAITAHRESVNWRIGDQQIDTRDLAARLLDGNTEYGRLIQPQLKSHAAMEELTGANGLSTVRIVTAVHKGKARVVYASQKLIGEGNAADNFLGGKTGNLLAAIDLSSGALGACFGKRKGDKYLLWHLDRHPDTGHAITGWQVPMWSELVRIAQEAALVMKVQPLLGFDVAITNNGPLILEANNNWSFSIPQITHRIGGRALLNGVLESVDLPIQDCDKVLKMINKVPESPD